MLKDFDEISKAERDVVRIISNYHTHNYLCGHAVGTACDYVKEAVEHGLETLGISDHCVPCEYAGPYVAPRVPSGYFGSPYITPQTLQTLYLPQIAEAKAKYGDKIRILTAVEIEYFPGNDDYYRDLLKSLDYLVLGQHEFYDAAGERHDSFYDGSTEKNILAYCDSVVDGLKTGMFAVLAHPDVILYRRPQITERVKKAFDKMIHAAVKHGVAVELNANGIRSHAFRYPTDLVVELCKKYNAPVVVSSDCHVPQYLCDEYMKALYAYAVKNKLNVVNTIKLYN